MVPEAGVLSYSVAAQLPRGEQTRLLVAVGGVVSYSDALHTVMSAQVRSLVAVAARFWYWVLVQTVRVAQTRSVVAVGAAVSYCVAEHAVKLAHTRLLVAVGAVIWYCAAVQTVSSLQTRLLVAVGAVLSYCEAVQTVSGKHPLAARYSVGAHEVPPSVGGIVVSGLVTVPSRLLSSETSNRAASNPASRSPAMVVFEPHPAAVSSAKEAQCMSSRGCVCFLNMARTKSHRHIQSHQTNCIARIFVG